MTLVALYYNPPQQQTTTAKWKRGLALLSSKYYNKKRNQEKFSPMTVAAATEKVLCHDNKQQRPQYIKCEDLTAKEFAQITGIKIKSSSSNNDDMNEILIEDNNNNNEHMITTTATITSSTTQMTSISNFTEFSSSKTSHIWDSDFWKCNTTHTPVMAKSSSSSSSSSNSNNSCCCSNSRLVLSRTHSTPSHDETTNTILKNNHNLTVPGVIQKGRFKIIIGQDDYSCEPVRQHVVFEWKRKRSNSSAISLSTKKK